MYSHFASYYGPPQNPSQCTSYLDSWTWKTRNKKESDRYRYITHTTIPTAYCATLGSTLPRRQHFQWTRCRTSKNNPTLHTPCAAKILSFFLLIPIEIRVCMCVCVLLCFIDLKVKKIRNEASCLYACMLGLHPHSGFVCLFVCLFVGIKPEKLYSASFFGSVALFYWTNGEEIESRPVPFSSSRTDLSQRFRW